MKPLSFLTVPALLGALLFQGADALAGANPSIGWNYGTIVATPHYPIVGESTHIDVVVNNPGDVPASNVQVRISFNDWGVTFQGWQEIATVTIPSIPAGGSATAQTDFVFQNRAHTCLEAVIVGAVENTNPDDDRGQINLEVINSGETFTWNVPVVNNGDQPRNLLLVGGCKGRGAIGQEPCREEVKEVVIGPGEEILVPVVIDLHAVPVGQEVEYELNAYDLGAGPAAFLPQNRNHVLLRVVRESAHHLKTVARTKAAALAGTQTSKAQRNRLEELVKQLDKALNPDLWLDPNRVKRAGGASVFAQTQAALNHVQQLLASPLSRNDKIVLDGIARGLSDSDRILAQTVQGDAGEIQEGDEDRARGDYRGAVNAYKHAWQNPQ